MEGRNKQFFEAIFNAIPEAVLVTDADLKIIHVNAAARALFSIPALASVPPASPSPSPSLSTKQTPVSLLEATFSAELENAAKKVIAVGQPRKFEIITYNKTKQCFFQALISPVEQIAPLEKNGIVIVLNDTTKLNKLEKVRKDFAANVSHELRTPIQLIKGFAETILEHSQNRDPDHDNDQLINGIRIILKNAVTMENLTNDLLTLVSLENEESRRPEMSVTNVRELLNEAINSVEPQAKAKNIKIKLLCDQELAASLYSSLITQAVINLLDNAVKYSPPSSKIKLKAESIPDKAGELIISVKDKGIGIPSEFQERIFERFFRVDRARSREAGGTGLGLAIVRHIAMLHNGKVKVESHAGEGSVFSIIIPKVLYNP